MFDDKKQLFDPKQYGKSKDKTAPAKENTNPFVTAALQKSSEILSGNGALKYSTTNNVFVDQFANASRYLAERPFADISRDMEILANTDLTLAVKFALYLRIVNRQVSFLDGSKTEKVQKGQGLKHEAIKRFMWLAINKPETFWKNIELFISAGSWKDIFQMLRYDLMANGWDNRKLNWPAFGKLILAGLENSNTSELVKKYLPAIKARSACTTPLTQANALIGKWLVSLLYGPKPESDWSSNRQYHKMKAGGKAHEWQKLISQGKHTLVDFNTVHGRALSKMVSGKYLKNNNLEAKYQAFIESQPIAKYTGFVHELAMEAIKANPGYKTTTVNSQFKGLVEKAKVSLENSPYNPICALDTSASMNSPMRIGNGKVGNMNSITVASSLTYFMNEFLPEDSMFKNTYLTFSGRSADMHKFSPLSFCTFMKDRKYGGGSTNFQGVFTLFAEIKRRSPQIPESQYPNMVICFSDGEFDSVGTGVNDTNVLAGRKALLDGGFSKEFAENFGMCFVDLPNTFYRINPIPKFEASATQKNVYHFSGYDITPLGFLFGNEQPTVRENGQVFIPSTSEELFLAAMDQEILNRVQ